MPIVDNISMKINQNIRNDKVFVLLISKYVDFRPARSWTTLIGDDEYDEL